MRQMRKIACALAFDRKSRRRADSGDFEDLEGMADLSLRLGLHLEPTGGSGPMFRFLSSGLQGLEAEAKAANSDRI